jgi:LPXTG-motif cell wall-anchored protein
VILGIIFGEDRLIGYSFIGAGVVLAIAWSLIARRRRRATECIDMAVRDD